MRRHAAALTAVSVVLLSTSCSSPASLSTTPAATPSAPTPSATALPTSAQANLIKTHELLFAWQDNHDASLVGYQIIAVLENQGAGWADLIPTQSRFSVLDASGNTTVDGLFTFGYPEFIAPGATGYLVGDGLSGGKVADFVTVTDSIGPLSFLFVTSPQATFVVSGITWRTEPPDYLGPGLTATGTVTTAWPTEIKHVDVAVLCIGSDGAILGATEAQLSQSISPNQNTSFETVSTTPPLKPSDCATSVGVAGTYQTGD